MNSLLPQTLNEALDYLMTISREGTRPEEAQAGLRILRERYPIIGMDLLWEEESYDHSMHYDTLLHLVGEGTVSLSFCPNRALPWPMRGVHRWSEGDLVRVNNVVLTVQKTLAYLDFIWEEAPIIKRLLNACLIQEALDKDPIHLSDIERQLAVDGFRRAHKLYRVDDTHHWMKQRGMTHKQLEYYAADAALVDKVRDRVTAGRVEDYFEKHQVDFDMAYVAQLSLSDKESAHGIYDQIQHGIIDFYEMAQQRFLEIAEQKEHSGQDIFAIIQRGQVLSELAKVLFNAFPGATLGPFRMEERYAIVRLLSISRARLDERTRTAIKKILFEEWLAERRQAATIEWYWGNADRISLVD